MKYFPNRLQFLFDDLKEIQPMKALIVNKSNTKYWIIFKEPISDESTKIIDSLFAEKYSTDHYVHAIKYKVLKNELTIEL